MAPVSEAERRLQQELRKKIEIVQQTPGRPSLKLIQYKLKYYGDKCYDINDVLNDYQNEFITLVNDRDTILNRRGGALHFYLKLKLLNKEHEQYKKECTSDMDNFVLAHEWYEILVAADEVEELARLEFLRNLKEEVHFVRTSPGEPGYPNMAEVRRSYDKSDVVSFVKRKMTQVDALLEEERLAVDEAKHNSRLTARLEEQTMTELRCGLNDLEDEVRNKFEDMDESVRRLEHECQVRLDQIIEGMESSQRLLARFADEIADGLKDLKLSHSESYRKGSKRKYDEEMAELCEKRRIYAQRLRDREEELKEIDSFLSDNVVRSRRFGDRTMKTHESTLMCVFCCMSGKHYSDACPKVRTVDERLKILEEAKRCTICVEKHGGHPCAKEVVCFYCKSTRSGSNRKADHHASVCRRPEQFAEAQRRRWETRAAVDMARRKLEECDAEMEAECCTSSRRDQEEEGTSGSSRKHC